MDIVNLFKGKVYNKLEFTVLTVIIISSVILTLFLVNRLGINQELTLPTFLKEGLPSKEYKNVFAPDAIWVATFGLLILWIIGVGIPLLWEKSKATYSFFFLCGKQPLNMDKCLNNIQFQGKVYKTKDGALDITNSDAGMLFRWKYWKNFEATFMFKFVGEEEQKSLKRTFEFASLKNKETGTYTTVTHKPKSNYLGFLFHAQDLNNYFMISIGLKDEYPEEGGSYSRKLLVTPHIKLDGKWEVHSSYKLNPDVIKLGNYDEIVCRVEDNKFKLKKIGNKERTGFEWNLPTNFWGPTKEENRSKEFSLGDTTRIPFRSIHGMIGLRAYGDEHIIVKNIEITRL